jgi:hypothetical protein
MIFVCVKVNQQAGRAFMDMNPIKIPYLLLQ